MYQAPKINLIWPNEKFSSEEFLVRPKKIIRLPIYTQFLSGEVRSISFHIFRITQCRKDDNRSLQFAGRIGNILNTYCHVKRIGCYVN